MRVQRGQSPALGGQCALGTAAVGQPQWGSHSPGPRGPGSARAALRLNRERPPRSPLSRAVLRTQGRLYRDNETDGVWRHRAPRCSLRGGET